MAMCHIWTLWAMVGWSARLVWMLGWVSCCVITAGAWELDSVWCQFWKRVSVIRRRRIVIKFSRRYEWRMLTWRSIVIGLQVRVRPIRRLGTTLNCGLSERPLGAKPVGL